MNVAWKFTAVLAMLFSLAALSLQVMQVQGKVQDDDVDEKVEVAMHARERELLSRLEPAVADLQQFRHMPDKSVKSLEDLQESILEIIAATPTARTQP